ncbi:GIN domain-containing protein [Parapedobacter sp. DT-150]|uniref:GIN domain-containing protein n=1 Tax=Parapedobacter sp. DT-150 TaxID=3396162 RepID=UPI003F1C9668
MNSLSPFHTVRILTRCEVYLYQDTSSAFHVDEPDDVAEWIDYHVDNGELIIQTKPMHYGFLLLSNSCPKIQLTCTHLNGIQLFDRANITTPEELRVEKLGVIIRQEGMVELNVDALRVDCTILKRGHVKVAGETIEVFLHAYHDGWYDGASLQASTGMVYLTNNARASVWIDGEMEARILGRSRFSYRGTPRFSWLSVDEGSRVEPLQETAEEKPAM